MNGRLAEAVSNPQIHGRIAELLCRIVGETNDATYDELTSALSKRGKIATSRSAVVRAMARLGFTRKKSLVATERNTPEHRERYAVSR